MAIAVCIYFIVMTIVLYKGFQPSFKESMLSEIEDEREKEAFEKKWDSYIILAALGWPVLLIVNLANFILNEFIEKIQNDSINWVRPEKKISGLIF